ncbi:hypothetical protein FSP39_002161 [Pinctada imbricata]|uniref:G-protein coupled receptors family 1 profile domain-containing protein n=1 Tax=Pinctada imbricata TaxID=66713 RepID=A0AA89BW67_PINIB|nr:hypothetical protein FSP39_002161 [Pinctada imbricata]
MAEQESFPLTTYGKDRMIFCNETGNCVFTEYLNYELGNKQLIQNNSLSVMKNLSMEIPARNVTNMPLPREMTFNDDSIMSVIAYSCMFCVAASGNLIVLITLFRSRRFKSRVNTFIMHLSIADLIVAFIMLPLEIAWHITVSWRAGDAACRILMFFRALGFYLSSFVLVTISLDRYFSIVHPLSLYDANKRGKIMLTLAWTLSVAASLPQVTNFNFIFICELSLFPSNPSKCRVISWKAKT